jgi:hypothetical protein
MEEIGGEVERGEKRRKREEREVRGGEDLANEISSALLKAYNILSLQELCIVPGFSCWKLYVDVLILECGGKTSLFLAYPRMRNRVTINVSPCR